MVQDPATGRYYCDGSWVEYFGGGGAWQLLYGGQFQWKAYGGWGGPWRVVWPYGDPAPTVTIKTLYNQCPEFAARIDADGGYACYCHYSGENHIPLHHSDSCFPGTCGFQLVLSKWDDSEPFGIWACQDAGVLIEYRGQLVNGNTLEEDRRASANQADESDVWRAGGDDNYLIGSYNLFTDGFELIFIRTEGADYTVYCQIIENEVTRWLSFSVSSAGSVGDPVLGGEPETPPYYQTSDWTLLGDEYFTAVTGEPDSVSQKPYSAWLSMDEGEEPLAVGQWRYAAPYIYVRMTADIEPNGDNIKMRISGFADDDKIIYDRAGGVNIAEDMFPAGLNVAEWYGAMQAKLSEVGANAYIGSHRLLRAL